jgi:hypothetical protein
VTTVSVRSSFFGITTSFGVDIDCQDTYMTARKQ